MSRPRSVEAEKPSSGGSASPRTGSAFVAALMRSARSPACGPIVGAIVLVAIFRGLSSSMLGSQEVSAATSLASAIGVVAIGAAFLMISGEFDLSVASVFAFAQILWAEFLTAHHMQPVLAFVIVILVAAGIGLVNGGVTVIFGIPSFVVTLAMFLAVNGISLIISGGNTLEYYGTSKIISTFGASINGYIAAPFVWFVGIALVGWFVLERTRYGNWSRSVGASPGVAFAMGIPVRKTKTINFVACAVLAAFSGCAQFAAFGSASAVNGSDYELYAIAAAVIGGTSLFGGIGSIIGVFFGALIVGVLESGFVLVGVPGAWYEAAIGGVLVLAVIVNARLAGERWPGLRSWRPLRGIGAIARPPDESRPLEDGGAPGSRPTRMVPSVLARKRANGD
jgi:simple sugar transport system permease protein